MSETSQEQFGYNTEQLQATIKKLIHENQMKDEALIKAQELLQLMHQELQNTRKNASQRLQDMQKTLKCQYEIQIEQLRSRIQFLQREIKRKNGHQRSIKKQKTGIPTLMLNPSQKSFDNTKQRTRVTSSRIITSFDKQEIPRTPKAPKSLLRVINSQKNLTVPSGLAASQVKVINNNKNFSIETQVLKQYVHQQIKQMQYLLQILSQTIHIEESFQEQTKRNLQNIEDQLNEHIFSGRNNELKMSNYSKQSPSHKISQQISQVLCSFTRESAIYQSEQQIGYYQIIKQQEQMIKKMKNTIEDQSLILKSYQTFIQSQNSIRLTDSFSQNSSSTNIFLGRLTQYLKKDNDILVIAQKKTRALLRQFLDQISNKIFKDQQHIYNLAKQCQQLREITQGIILIIKKQNLLVGNNMPMYKMST